MLQDIRQSVKGTAAKIVVGLIVISFAFFGIEAILLNGGGNEIAVINGEEIYPQDLQQALNSQKRRLIAMMGDSFDPSLLDDERLKPQVMESLINRQLLLQAAGNSNLAVSEEVIGVLIGNMDEFQIDGKFSPETYKLLLSNAGYTPAYFKKSMREDLLLAQLRGGLAGSEFATSSELKVNARVLLEQRDVEYCTLPQNKFVTNTEVDEAQIDEYYQKNQDAFLTPDSLDLEYIEISAQDLVQPVTDLQLNEAYALAIEGSQYQSQNRVSHILFEPDSEVPVEERVAEAQKALASGMDFATVAKNHSDDLGSANRGGDLGYSSGEAFPAEMELVVAQLEIGVVSEPVETDSGTHLVVVTERKDAVRPSLDEMREDLRESIALQAARVELLTLVDSLKDLSFNAESLAAPASELGLTVQRADGITRQTTEAPFVDSRLLEAAFSEEVLESGHNSDVIEIEASRYIVLRVRQHNFPEVKPLGVVRDEVIANIERDNASKALLKEAERALSRLQSGETLAKFAIEAGYECKIELAIDRRNSTIPPELLQRAFELAIREGESSSADYLETKDGNVTVLELTRVEEGDFDPLDSLTKQQLRQQSGAELGGLLDGEYQYALRQNADIVVR